MVIDDCRNRRHVADILVSDTNARFDPTLNGCPRMARELVGAQFALVDPEFAFSEETSISVESKKRLLVSYGGSDPTDETTKALEAVRLLRHNEQCREWLGEEQRLGMRPGHGAHPVDQCEENCRSSSGSHLAGDEEDENDDKGRDPTVGEAREQSLHNVLLLGRGGRRDEASEREKGHSSG